MRLVITGIYEKTLFRDESTGFTIFSIFTKYLEEHLTDYGTLVCYATIPFYTKGVPLMLVGDIKGDGDRVHFDSMSVTLHIDSETASRSFLINTVEGIGHKKADKIIAVTGIDIFAFVTKPNAFDILQNADILSNGEIETVISTTLKFIYQKKVYDYIAPFGGDHSSAVKIYERCGNKSIDMLKRNCYSVGLRAGMTFTSCDAIFKHNGGLFYDKLRIEYLLIHTLTRLSSLGHTYSKIEDIVEIIGKVRKSLAFPDYISINLLNRAAFTSNRVAIEKGKDGIRYYLRDLFFKERDIVSNLNRLSDSAVKTNYKDEIAKDVEKKQGIVYSAKQKEAFNFLKSTGVKILTGGPGTGKTTLVNGLILAYKAMYPSRKVVLCAPTGRAAQRLSESTGRKASTLHRTLNVKPYDNLFTSKDKNNPLDGSLIIVDEVSMVDTSIFSILLGAVKNRAMLILCGDADQLPSVGAGNILSDLISSEKFETVKLDVNHRQKDKSLIIENASRIKNGIETLLTCPLFSIIEVEDESLVNKKSLDLMDEHYKKDDVFNVQLLSSTKQHDAGIFVLNNALQAKHNKTKNGVKAGGYTIKVNDKIMTTRNNYDIGYTNGDVGIVKKVTDSLISLDINGVGIVDLPKEHFGDVSLAYAQTIHKSQGSEYETIIVTLPAHPEILLKRNLLYTAITRAKSKVYIVAEKGAIKTAINNIDTQKRRTGLLDKLNGTHTITFLR